MASYIKNAAVTGDAVSTGDILLKSILITNKTGTSSVVTVYSNGVAALILSCKDQSFNQPATSGGNQFSLISIPGPVTIDVPANTFVRMDW